MTSPLKTCQEVSELLSKTAQIGAQIQKDVQDCQRIPTENIEYKWGEFLDKCQDSSGNILMAQGLLNRGVDELRALATILKAKEQDIKLKETALLAIEAVLIRQEHHLQRKEEELRSGSLQHSVAIPTVASPTLPERGLPGRNHQLSSFQPQNPPKQLGPSDASQLCFGCPLVASPDQLQNIQDTLKIMGFQYAFHVGHGHQCKPHQVTLNSNRKEPAGPVPLPKIWDESADNRAEGCKNLAPSKEPPAGQRFVCDSYHLLDWERLFDFDTTTPYQRPTLNCQWCRSVFGPGDVIISCRNCQDYSICMRCFAKGSPPDYTLPSNTDSEASNPLSSRSELRLAFDFETFAKHQR